MKCWTCGSPLNKFGYMCPACKNLKAVQRGNERLTALVSWSAKQESLDRENQRYFAELSQTLTAGLSQVASAIAWGQRNMLWQLEQQSDTLRSIDNTLKTPRETGANELRQQAEEALRREALVDAETLYTQALELNRLDYRIYLGLAETYLQREKPDQAEDILQRSLPHAPATKRAYYQSYSLRLIGHIYACKEAYPAAAEVLREAVDLSPTYAEALYDYSQYCALIGRTQDCLRFLERAISARPLYLSLARAENNFAPVMFSVNALLDKRKKEENYQLAQQKFKKLVQVCGKWKGFDTHLTTLQEKIHSNGDLRASEESLHELNAFVQVFRRQLQSRRDSSIRERDNLDRLAKGLKEEFEQSAVGRAYSVGCLLPLAGFFAAVIFWDRKWFGLSFWTFIVLVILGQVKKKRYESMQPKIGEMSGTIQSIDQTLKDLDNL
jgi:tetratricopeptide (TPR) repeat protein